MTIPKRCRDSATASRRARGMLGYRRGAVTQRMADTANRLARTMLVLDQREADEAVAVRTEAGPGRDRDLGVVQQELCEFERSHRAKRLRNRRPYEHRRTWLFDRPSRPIEPVA